MQGNVYLGLGSNLGERETYLDNAISCLEANNKINVLAKSAMVQTEPVGEVAQPMFLNMAVEIETSLSPNELLQVCLDIELTQGRERLEKWGARTIDIDILFYNDIVFKREGLQIPHPEAHRRVFVLQPLAEIAPLFEHPVLKQTITAILQRI
jgi:2-amino-4-hydroxy-6-hydroxymethyldihydropteridine diphosphokinase